MRKGKPARPAPHTSSGSGPHTAPRGGSRSGPHTGSRSGPKIDALWVWGAHSVKAALNNPQRHVKRLVVVKTALAGVESQAKARSLVPEMVEVSRLAAMLPADAVHQGLAALLGPLKELDLIDAVEHAKRPRRVVVLDQVSDPHNIGAILRSAAAFRACAVVVQERHTPQVSGIIAKTSSGATEIVPMVRVVNLARTLEELDDLGFLRVGLADEATTDIAQCDSLRDIAIVLGAEGEGMRRLTRENCDALVRLPTRANMPSLNVSNAAAVALFALNHGG